MAEAELYGPIKRFLEANGYEVKGEIGPCDLVAVGSDGAEIIVELKERLSLALVLQAVDRLAIGPPVYIAFRTGRSGSATWRAHRRQVIGLLRRLGVGLLTVADGGRVAPVLDPAPYRPRPNVRRRHRLLREFAARVGDPEIGGSVVRPRQTAYRQDAVRCARELAASGTLKVSVLRDRTGVARAGSILRDDHYGWFERVDVGHYTLTTKGHGEHVRWIFEPDRTTEPPDRR